MNRISRYMLTNWYRMQLQAPRRKRAALRWMAVQAMLGGMSTAMILTFILALLS